MFTTLDCLGAYLQKNKKLQHGDLISINCGAIGW